MKIDKAEIVKKLLIKATELGYDAVTIANALKIRPQTVEDWFEGKRLPRINNIVALSKFLGIPFSFLKKGFTRLTDIPTAPYYIMKELFSEISKKEAEELEELIHFWRKNKKARELFGCVKQMDKKEIEDLIRFSTKIIQFKRLDDEVRNLKSRLETD